ncbi:ribonuclease H-like domain-containing protein [Rhodocollybia butyracea]|uniref:3'-5' exonuclease n=1 Tax=Rhodocollybia butyracea TaxID=206335 RepID=A0A9P5Q4B0_9AGAR|nr:ribonuclease H-like domain-containing protein [Rhodocollybia butyracea]
MSSFPLDPYSLQSPADLMVPYYLKNEQQASVTLRHVANTLNGLAYWAFISPEAYNPPHIGFDLEWKPIFRSGQRENPVAVIQIAYQTASYVIHVKWMQALPDGLKEILENPRIVKVGVGIQHDAKKLWTDCRISVSSCVDLALFVKCIDSGLFAQRLDRYADIPLVTSTRDPPTLPPDCQPSEFYNSEAFLGPHFYRRFRGSYSNSIGLARLAEIYCGLTLTKGKITCSNWEAELTPEQITYAALDACAGYIVYAHLVELFNLLEPTKRPKRKFYAFDRIQGNLYHCCGSDRRTLLGEQMEDSTSGLDNGYPSTPLFRLVEEEISLHFHGIGADQTCGLLPWIASNPEYDPGPMPPRLTLEEKEAAKKARQKRQEEKKTEEADTGAGHAQNAKEGEDQHQVASTRPPLIKPGRGRGPPNHQARHSAPDIATSMQSLNLGPHPASLPPPPRFEKSGHTQTNGRGRGGGARNRNKNPARRPEHEAKQENIASRRR